MLKNFRANVLKDISAIILKSPQIVKERGEIMLMF